MSVLAVKPPSTSVPNVVSLTVTSTVMLQPLMPSWSGKHMLVRPPAPPRPPLVDPVELLLLLQSRSAAPRRMTTVARSARGVRE
jgi:hypothetical protein